MGYKREAAESLEVDEGNADYDYDYKEGALAWPTAGRHHAGKSSLPAEKLNFAQYGKRATPTSMEAEYSLEVRLVLLETLATASDTFSQLQPHVQPTATAVDKTK